MSFDPFGGPGGGSSLRVWIVSAMARYEHLPIYKAALDVAMGLENPMLGDLAAQRWNVEHLAGLDDHGVGQRTMTGSAVARRTVRLDAVRLHQLLQGVASVSLLVAGRLLTRLAPAYLKPGLAMLFRPA